jgi:hypothetical protein
MAREMYVNRHMGTRTTHANTTLMCVLLLELSVSRKMEGTVEMGAWYGEIRNEIITSWRES